MSEALSRAFVSDIEVRSDGTGRTVHGIVVPFDHIARVRDAGRPAYDEAFQRGAFTKTIAERGARVKLLSQHNRGSNPLGRATLLREDAAGLYGEFHVSNTRAGDEVPELIRDGALDSFSAGFTPIQHVNRNGVTMRTEVGLREVSLVTFPAYEGALVGGVRAIDLTPQVLADIADLLRESELAATPSEPAALDTSAEAVPAVDEPVGDDHSARHAKSVFDFRAFCAERGLGSV